MVHKISDLVNMYSWYKANDIFLLILILLSYQVCTSQAHANSNSDRVDYLIELLQEPLDTKSQEEIKGAIIRIWKLSKSEEIQQKMNNIGHFIRFRQYQEAEDFLSHIILEQDDFIGCLLSKSNHSLLSRWGQRSTFRPF